MPLRVRCPRCGRVEEYEPSGEELKIAQEKGVASISFFHGDHTLVVFFDKSGLIRRLSAIKAVSSTAMASTPASALEDLCTLLGREKTAYLLSAFLSQGRLILLSSSTNLAFKIYQALKGLSGLERPALVVEEPGELGELPDNAVLIMSKEVSADLAHQLGEAAVIDLEAIFKPKRKDRKGLKAMLDIIERASHLGEETRSLFLKEKLGRLRNLVEKAMELLGENRVLNEDVLKQAVGGLDKEESHWLHYVLEEFGSVEPARLRAHGVREFAL